MKKLLITLFVQITFLVVSSPMAAHAQSEGKSKKKVRKQSLDFEDELVEGAAQKPELFFILKRRNFNYKKLIKLRKNFIPEMRKTSEVIQPTGSGR